MALIFVFLLFRFREVLCIVDCGPATFQISIDQECMEIDDISLPMVTTQGATVNYSCYSLLWRTKAGFDYCPVERCESNGEWRQPSLSCGSSECYNGTSQAYTGLKICTVSGKICQRWDSQSPHPHEYTDASSFPDATLGNASNYCRDPDGVEGEPWCYTDEPGTEKEMCGIPDCADMTIGQGQCPDDYCGDPDETVTSDHTCASIALPPPVYSRLLGSVIAYACQSLLTGFTSAISYCPVCRCQDNFFWSAAAISCGYNECYTATQSGQYQGKRTCTTGGWTCQRWDSQIPHDHPYTAAWLFPDASDAENFCRDPDNVVGEPWCYTTNPAVQTQTCGIPECSTLPVNSGRCSDPAVSTVTPPSTTAPTETPPTRVAEFTHYEKTQIPRTGYEAQYTVPYVITPINCARMCHQQSGCVLLSYDSNKSCTLHRQNPDITYFVDCTLTKCYIENILV